MASTFLQPVPQRRRATAFGLTLLVHALLALLLLNLAPRTFEPAGDQGALATFDVGPAAPATQASEPTERAREPEQVREPEAAPPPRRTAPPPSAPPERPAPPADTTGIIWMDRSQFAASDITGKGSADARGERADTRAESAQVARNSKPVYGPSLGPGGAPVYDIEAWVREPTSAELGTYLPEVPVGSWGAVICRTIPGNRVDNCRTTGESPVGSGLATGIRRAAWQFQVLPPRVDGKPLIGAWVRIRIRITVLGAAAR